MNFIVVAAASLATLAAVHGVTFLIGRYHVVDVAWGIGFVAVAAVAAALGTGGLLTVLSPVLMSYFLVYAAGAKLTEKYLRNRPGFAEYRSHTSFFVPAPPKSR
jgi:steroid 5-alpha reductase family enzyme